MRNKSSLLILLYMLVFVLPAQARRFNYDIPQYNHEISISYGYYSTDMVFDGWRYKVPSEYYVLDYSGAVTISYKYFVTSYISLGVSAAYENESGLWQHSTLSGSDNWSTVVIGDFKRMAFTVAPEVSFTYVKNNTGTVRFYCLMGVGGTYQNEVDIYSDYYYTKFVNGVNSLGPNLQVQNDRWHLNAQISPIGLAFGGKIGGYFELGMGYRGVFNFGINVKL